MDQTAQFLLPAWNPGRPWPKQVGAQSGKCPLTRATDHVEASGETTSLYENRSNPPRALSKGGSSKETSPPYRPGRRPCCEGRVKHFASLGRTSPTGCATRLCAASAAESEGVERYRGCWKTSCTPD